MPKLCPNITFPHQQDFFPIRSVTKSSTARFSHENLVEKFKIFVQDFVPVRNKILNKNLDLTQDFLNKISFHFLWVKMLLKNLPKIFRWPEMCPLDKILAQDFQMAALTKILGRRDKSVVPLLSTENCQTLLKQKRTQHVWW